jgi:hypothetical protein
MSSATEQLPVAMLNGVEGGGAVAVLRCCCGKKLECSDLNRQKLAISISGDVLSHSLRIKQKRRPEISQRGHSQCYPVSQN